MAGINEGSASVNTSPTTLDLPSGSLTIVSVYTIDAAGQVVPAVETLTGSDNPKVIYTPYLGLPHSAGTSESSSGQASGSSSLAPVTAIASSQAGQGVVNGSPTSSSAASATSTASTTSAVPVQPAGKKSNAGAIAGGVVGGLVVIAVILAIIVLVRRRKQKQRRVTADAAIPTKGNTSYDESPVQAQASQQVYETASYAPTKAFDRVPVPAPATTPATAPAADSALERSAYATAKEPKSTASPAATSQQEVHMPMSREVNEDGVSLRSASPDLTDVADRHSFIEEAGTRGVPRLPRQDREDGEHGSAL